MLERLQQVTADAILGLMAAYRADPDPRKVDLGVGVYRDARGDTPVLAAVRSAESSLIAAQTTKTYVSSVGNVGFNEQVTRLTFGADHPTVKANRVRTVQTPGGCGALRLAAELIRLAAPATTVHVSSPTWANHEPLLGNSGLTLERYPYFDAATGGVEFPLMMAALEKLPPRAVVLLHASCHNPTGADLSEDEWHAVLELVRRRDLLPFIDMAYQGLGGGIDEDAFAPRLFAAELPEVICAVSCSKNFGLYRERTGALHVIGSSPAAADAALSQLARLARGIWSMPPDHGAEIVRRILSDSELSAGWQRELRSMRERILALRQQLLQQLREHCPRRDFGFITRQRGMFSFLGIGTGEILRLRAEHHIYLTDDSRINIAGLREDNLAYVARAVAQVLGEAR